MDSYIPRSISPFISDAHRHYPVTLLSGARQVGKSTLCRHLFPDYRFVNLENPTPRSIANADPNGFLDSLGDTAIIDEAQNCPGLLSAIQARVDENPKLRYVLTGSSDFALMHTACQSLAGRVALFTLPPFTFGELGAERIGIPTEELIWRGFYPGVIANGISPDVFYRNYYNTYIEKDVRNLLNVKNLNKFDIFMRLMAGRVGSESNASSLSAEVGVSSNTISEWVSILEASYIIFPLRPYFANISKRLSKMPKWYFYDSGLAAYLLGVEAPSQLSYHPLKGALFENMVVAEFMKRRLDIGKDTNLNFYRERSGKEVDILQTFPDGLRAYEIKSAKTFNSEFTTNLEYLKKSLPEPPVASSVIYDGETFRPTAINLRDL